MFASPRTYRLTRPVVVHFDSDSIDIPLKLRPYRRIRIWEKNERTLCGWEKERREKKKKIEGFDENHWFSNSFSLIFRSMKMKRIDSETNVNSI